uniref:Uncharacterized protein n=1 Tax=Fagus sylvatica TaxID=28930 RepID=A0A2N9G5K3_FAGSY
MGEITHNGLSHALLSLAEIEHELLSLAELHALLSLVKLSHAFLMHSSHWPAHALFSLVELSHAFLMHSSHWPAHALFSLVELSHAFLMHNQDGHNIDVCKDPWTLGIEGFKPNPRDDSIGKVSVISAHWEDQGGRFNRENNWVWKKLWDSKLHERLSYVKEVGISSNLEKRRDKARWSKPPEGVGKLNVDACLYAWKSLLSSVTTEP